VHYLPDIPRNAYDSRPDRTLAKRLFPLTSGTLPIPTFTSRVAANVRIDGTVLTIASKPYFVWSCLRPVAGFQKPQQSICISKLTTPTSIDSANIGVLSVPDQKWEQIGTTDVPAVNEAPQPMYWAGQT